MAEYISREAVNDLIEDIRNNHFILMSDRVTLLLLKSKVAEIPSADVQPVKRGHWIEEVREIGETFRLYQTYIHCSECGKEHYSGTLPKPNFCDECGARMDGEQNENN